MSPAQGRFVVMGVSGAGKSRVGALLAQRLGGAFVEGDDLHPESNRRKMAGGTPLTDEDRAPWLDRVAEALAEAPAPAVAACSALRRAYRDRLRLGVPGLVVLHLAGSREAIAARLARRQGHFMPPALLGSQLATLEPLGADERGVTVETGEGPLEEVVEALLAGIARL